MSRLLSTEPVAVRIGECECPDKPHSEGDHAYLRPRLTVEGGITAQAIMVEATDVPSTMAALGHAFLRDGLLRWDLLDDAGRPVPLSAISDGSLDWETVLLPLAEKANELYAESVMRPLVKRLPARSQPGQTEASTSPTTPSPQETPPEPSTT